MQSQSEGGHITSSAAAGNNANARGNAKSGGVNKAITTTDRPTVAALRRCMNARQEAQGLFNVVGMSGESKNELHGTTFKPTRDHATYPSTCLKYLYEYAQALKTNLQP